MRNFRRLVRELKPFWNVMVAIGFLTLATAALGLPGPLIVEYLINHLTARQPINLFYVLLAFITVAISAGIVGFLLTVTVTYLGQRFKYEMRRRLYAHMQT